MEGRLWIGRVSAIALVVSTTASAQQACSPCSEIREAASAALEACSGLQTTALLNCLKPFDELRRQYHACLDAEAASSAPGYCPSKAIGYQSKPKQKPQPPVDCGYKRVQGADVPFDINADTVKDFLDQVNSKLNGAHTAAETEVKPEYNEDNVLSNAHISYNVQIVVPKLGLGRLPEAGKKFFKKIASIMQKHEFAHLNISEGILKKLGCDIVGKSQKDADAAIDHALCVTIPKAQKALDDKEGKIDWVYNGQHQVIDVTTAPYVRPLSDYVPPTCKPET